MNIHRTKIEWATHVWNPITGCNHGCRYCYAKRIIDRFAPKMTERPEPGSIIEEAPGIFCATKPVRLVDSKGEYTRSANFPTGFNPTFYRYQLDYPTHKTAPCRVFVVAMGDMFGEWVPDEWIEKIFEACAKAPQHKWIFLTKNPARYLALAGAGKLPKDSIFWFGSTITTPDTPFYWSNQHKTFVSIEPLLAPFDEVDIEEVQLADWIIVGNMTGAGSKKHQPKREWVEAVVNAARQAGKPVFMKNGLKELWGEPLIQEYPPELLLPNEIK